MKEVRWAMKSTFSNVGKGTNFLRNIQSESWVGVGWEVGGGWVGVVKELGKGLTFVCI